jgi:D-aminoacyl-tRNA deacylase
MKAWIQRVSRGRVTVEGRIVGEVGPGYVVLLGVKTGDQDADARYLAAKTASLRIFEDDAGKMNRSVLDTGGSVLVVPQFTLYADTRRGNRPSFIGAAPPEVAERLYGVYVADLGRILGAGRVATGAFRATMSVELVNEGPVTVELTSDGRPGT